MPVKQKQTVKRMRKRGGGNDGGGEVVEERSAEEMVTGTEMEEEGQRGDEREDSK